MRAWENRPDTVVVDEPLYAHYLAATGIDHPGAAEVIEAGETDWRRVVASLLAPPPARDRRSPTRSTWPTTCCPTIDHAWIGELTNVLLIRDPREVVASYTRTRATVTPDDIGLPQQVRLYDELPVRRGAPPPVIDAGDFLARPRALPARAVRPRRRARSPTACCRGRPGPRPTDGPWAPHWYDAVWRSTGFEPPRTREVHLDGPAAEVAEACLPLYERLHAARWVL